MSSIDTPAGPSTKSEPTALAGFRVPRLGTIVLTLVAVALALRLWELGERPFHHDESLDAWWSARFRDGIVDPYDPVYHGPLRFYITAGFYELFGETDAAARLFSALSGTAVVGLPWFLRRELGRVGTIAAAVALTISPTMLYYSRFGREDAQMVFLTLLAMVLGLSYLRNPRIATATGLTFTLACSFAIKESTYLFALLLVVFMLIVLAAQFDAQNRISLGLESDPHRLNPAFVGSALLFATIGLIVAVVIGARADELFPMLTLYLLALVGFVAAVALEDPEPALVGRAFGRDDVAGLDQRARDEIEALRRAVDQERKIAAAIHPLEREGARDAGAERFVAPGRRVVERLDLEPAERGAKSASHVVERHVVGRWYGTEPVDGVGRRVGVEHRAERVGGRSAVADESVPVESSQPLCIVGGRVAGRRWREISHVHEGAGPDRGAHHAVTREGLVGLVDGGPGDAQRLGQLPGGRQALAVGEHPAANQRRKVVADLSIQRCARCAVEGNRSNLAHFVSRMDRLWGPIGS